MVGVGELKEMGLNLCRGVPSASLRTGPTTLVLSKSRDGRSCEIGLEGSNQIIGQVAIGINRAGALLTAQLHKRSGKLARSSERYPRVGYFANLQ